MRFLYFFYFLGLLVTISQASSASNVIYDVNYLGCYKDNTTRDLNIGMKNDPNNLTLESCFEFCSQKNTYFAAAEIGRQCFCGDSYGKYGKLEEKSCSTPCSGNPSQTCGGQFAMSVYNITNLVPCKYTNMKCGEGAFCVNRNAQAVCECPVGKEGDPYEKCIDLPMSCGCWGDPHCHTFDKSIFDFMGRCIYDLITTDCFNKTLPKGLEPFKVRVKQAKIDGVPNADKVAFIRYVEILVEGTKYRLGTDSKVQAVDESSIRFYVNNTLRNPPYQDPLVGIQVYMAGGYLIFSSQFGLTVTWGGKSKVDVLLSSSYSGLVCGLCGDGDKNAKNDFVDRNNKMVKLSVSQSAQFTKHFAWGKSWRISPSEYPLSDTSVDLDSSLCASEKCTSPNNCTVPSFECKNYSLYDISNNWCGIMRNKTGPWARCIELINPTQASGAILGCIFDMCALEGNESQEVYRCAAYETFTSQCYDAFNYYKEKTVINWREATNCPRPCKNNQVYDVRAQCPRSCLFPQGNPDCGVLKPIEGCYCKPGYVLDSNQNCIEESECGCKLPDNSTTLPPGGKLVSIDCKVIYTCNGPLQNVTIENITPCSSNGYCSVENNTPKCFCNEGYQGNGYLCQPIPPPIINCTKTSCGVNAVCNVIREIETCSCPTGTVGNPLDKCIQPPMSCGCWGDPHCHTFDKSSFDFMGRCIYDMISTDCFNKKLPSGLENFKVRVKQEKRENVPNANNVAFIRYIEVLVYNNSYKLETVSPTELITKGMERLYVNGVLKKPPYQDKKNEVRAYISGGYLRFTTKFGLSITWGGKSQAEILLSSSYSGFVCGLCGNGDGISTNDFVNRKNVDVALVGDRFTKYFNWGSSWKIPASEYPSYDNSIDLNNQRCTEETELCVDPEKCTPIIHCENPDLYENNDYWCGIMKNIAGPWAACISIIGESQLKGLINGCVFDMCALEGNQTIQEEYRCIAYATFTAQCYDIFNTNGIGSVIEWRHFTNCPIPCKENEVYDVRAQCPRSCLFPQGDPDCGVLDPIEGCYCKPGYVLDSNQNCIEESECGCIIDQNDGLTILEIGEKITTSDCTLVSTCVLNDTRPVVKNDYMTKCSENAICLIDEKNNPSCMCLLGYQGDGYNCQPIPPPTLEQIELTSLATTVLPDPSLCNGYYQLCTLYGDPHYITTSGFKFNMNDNCTYLIATDECNPDKPKSYEIFASHQFRYNRTDVSYFKTVTIKTSSSQFEINDGLKLNGEPLELPYVAADGLTEVRHQGPFIEIRTIGFLLKYYPGEILKFYPCSAREKPFCGLCALKDESEINQYWNTDISCLPRQPTVV